MKFTHLVFLVYLFSVLSLSGAFKYPKPLIQKKTVVTKSIAPEELDPIEEDKKLDNALFNYFVKILANFCYILLDPHNKTNVTYNAGKMIEGVVSVAQELTRKPVNKKVSTKKQPTKKQLDSLVRLISLTLTKQGLLPPHQVTGYSIS